MTTAIDARTVQREEAMRRLKALRLHENVVRDFASGKLNLSERAVFPNGQCFRETEKSRLESSTG